MRAGDLRHALDYVTLRGSTAFDGRGQSQMSPVVHWAGLAAEITQLTAREAELAHKLYPTATHRIRTRYFQSGHDPTARFIFGSRTFHIESVENVNERNIEMIFIVSEEIPAVG